MPITFPGRVGQAEASNSAGTLQVVVGAAGVPLGERVHVVFGSTNLSSDAPPTCADSKGNVYTLDDTGGAATRTATVFSAKVTTPLVNGDTITVTCPVTTRRAMDVLRSTQTGNREQSKQVQGSNAVPASGNLNGQRTTLAAFVLNVCCWNGTLGTDVFTPAAPYTNGNTVGGAAASNWKLVGSAIWLPVASGVEGTGNGAITTAGSWTALAVVYPDEQAVTTSNEWDEEDL